MNLIRVLWKKDIDQILDKLNKIEGMLEEMQSEQKERANSGPPIIASLEAMSRYYMDYLAKQKGEAEEEEEN